MVVGFFSNSPTDPFTIAVQGKFLPNMTTAIEAKQNHGMI